MKVCDNCHADIHGRYRNDNGTINLGGGYQIGPDLGGQRDSYRKSIDLCAICRLLLEAADFGTLANRRRDYASSN